MASQQGGAQTIDSGAFALAIFLRLHGVAGANPHQFQSDGAGSGDIGIKEILKRARECGVRAGVRAANWPGLMRIKLPAIAVLRGGDFLVLGKASEEGVVVVRPTAAAPK